MMARLLQGKGRVIELEGIPGTSAALERGAGFNEALKAFPEIKVVAREVADFEQQKARQAGLAEPTAAPFRLPPPTIDLPLPAFIPEEYVADLNTRLGLYQKLVKLERIEQIEPLAQEFSDRFGELPPEVKNLFLRGFSFSC